MTEVSKELIARVQRGDQAACQELYRETVQVVYRTVYRILGKRAGEVDDVVQQVFLEVFRSIDQFEWRSQFQTWLYRVTVNTALNYQRSWRDWFNRGEEEAEAISPPVVNPEHQAMSRQTLQEVSRVLDKMGEKKRVVFVLHELEGLASDEIASVLGVPVATVNSRLFHARQALWAWSSRQATKGAYVYSR